MWSFGRSGLVETAKDHLFAAHQSTFVDDGSVLLRGRTDRSNTRDACVHLLTASGAAGAVVFVTADPTEQLAAWRERLEGSPARISIVTPAEDPLSDVEWLTPAEAEVVPVTDASDLKALGTTIADSIDPSRTPAGGVTVCCDILGELIRRFELQTVFRFLHLLAGRIRRAGALAHFHFEAGNYPDAVANMITPAFERTLAVEDGVFTDER